MQRRCCHLATPPIFLCANNCSTPSKPRQIEKLRLAAEMLPPDDATHKAARLVEQALLSSPWSLTDAFVAHFRWAGLL